MRKKLLYYLIAGILFTAILGTLSHFAYEWSGNNQLVGWITPVNESVWEHMKLLFFPMVFYGIFALPRLKNTFPCITYGYLWGILGGTLAIPVLYYTYSGILGTNNTVIDILIFYLCVFLGFAITYILSPCRPCPCGKDYKFYKQFLKFSKKLKNPLLPVILVLVLGVCFLLFTKSAPKLGIFLPPNL